MRFKIYILIHLISIKFQKWYYRKALKNLQNKGLKSLFRKLKNSPFYQSIMNREDSLSNFPIIDKSVFMRNFDIMNTCGLSLAACMEVAEKAEKTREFSSMINGITVGLSTGTSGNRGIFLANKNERALWVAYILDRVIGFSLKRRKVAFFLRANSNLYQSTQSKLLQFQFFDIFINFEEHIQRLNELKPDIIVAQPSLLNMLADKRTEGILKVNPSKIISVAEVLTEEDKIRLESIFDQKIHQVYQCTEGFLASTCEHGTLHFNEDFLIIEKKYLNKEKTKFHPVITDLKRSTQPIVRYELNDIITEKKDCNCGSKMLAIESIEGRSDDILSFINKDQEHIKMFPDIFRKTIVLSDENIQDYCLIQNSTNSLQLYIKANLDDSYVKAKDSLTTLLSENHIDNVSFERLIHSPFVIGNKKRRIKNESSKTS
jgi:putative adenylate-forming enzyme